MGILIADKYKAWEDECNTRFHKLKANEEELNRIFIDIYGLQNELTPEVEDKNVTVHRADLVREIKSLISYAVGCMFGRYSLDKAGLCYTGGDFNAMFKMISSTPDVKHDGHKSRYYLKECLDTQTANPKTQNVFGVDADNIIPITDDEYFADDIVSFFVEFISIAYGADTLEANLRYIADALGGKGTPRDIIRAYFLNDFYADHLKVYQKRPIYWLFSSGKKNGFKCLIYMHRYQPDTIARIRTDYIHELQSRYITSTTNIETRLQSTSGSDAVKLKKQLKKLQEQSDELNKYEEKIHHLADQMIAIDLDDGVKVNYEKFGDVLAVVN